MLVWKTNNKEFWTAVLVMPSEHAAWPDYMANYRNMGSVPRCTGYCYSLRESKCLNEPDRSSWSIVLVLITKKFVLYCSFGDAVSTCRWPNYIANYNQRRSVQRCPCAWKCSDRIIVHVCKTSCLHSILQYPPDFVYHSGSAEWENCYRKLATFYWP